MKDESKDPLEFFLRNARVMDEQLGPILFQLPPNMKVDVPRLTNFLSWLPADVRAAFEFRHASWFDDVVYDALRAGKASLCIADTEDEQTPRVATVADWGYVRLRRVAYTEADIAEWAAWTSSQSWHDAYVFFKHEDAGTGPRLAKSFEAAFSSL